MKKRALITGITGQDGSYLAEFLIEKNYEVHGLIRRSSTFNTSRIDGLFQDPHEPNASLFLHYGDMTDANSIEKVLKKVAPQEVYNLAAQSHVRVSFDLPLNTSDVVGMGCLRLLEAIHSLGMEKEIRFYQASSSEMYGNAPTFPQTEDTPFRPASPYACAKLFAHNTTNMYRAAYGLHASNGILFNHESPRRGETFVSRKITRGIARILAGKEKKIFLGNLEARRDWGFTKDYIEAMWIMLQQEKPDDYVIATGTSFSVKDFLEKAFTLVKMDWQEFVRIDERYYRPNEVAHLIGDSSKALKHLGWKPRTSFDQLVKIMLQADLEAEGVDVQLN
jgi:GDPmannose 4,6-dehydratase